MRTSARIGAVLVGGLLAASGAAWGENPTPPGGSRPPRAEGGNRPPRLDGERRPPRPDAGQGGGQQYTLEQAISDRAQLNTIAFSGLAFITGTFGGNTFLPPGKVADYFGFQYMRDVQPNGMGHNTDFLTRIANNMLYVLTDAQKAQLIALAREQEGQWRALAAKRFPMIQAFCRQLAGEIPAGSSGLDRAAVKSYTAEIFALDGELAYRRAVVCGAILAGMTPEQQAYLGRLKFADYTTWPEAAETLDRRSLPHDVHVLVMTYASEMFSWYAGSVDADVYFCPERHGTYFGGFYMKDAPAMGQRNYTISTSLTGNSGEQFLATLDEAQRAQITAIVELQRADLQEIVATRRAISVELRKCLAGESADQARVQELSRRYGELDGELSWFYATRFAAVGQSLTADQRAALVKLRNMELTPAGAFIYSEPVALPEHLDTDFFFGVAGAASPTVPAVGAGTGNRNGTRNGVDGAPADPAADPETGDRAAGYVWGGAVAGVLALGGAGWAAYRHLAGGGSAGPKA